MAEKRYDSSNIKNLQFPENVRTKPTLYIGPIDGAGIFSILREVTDNCVDEALQGRCKICYVHVGRDNEYWVADDGAGIPVGKIEVEDPITHKKHKVPALKAAVGMLNTSGKFDDQAYAISRGTHGIGAKATNALSTEFEVWTHRSGEWYTTSYRKGVEKREVTKTKAPTNPVTGKRMTRGTLVRFKPDLSIFTESRFAMKLLVEWSTIAAFFTPAFRIVLSNDEGSKKEFHFPNGPIDYIKSRVEKLQAEPLSPKAFAASNAFVDCVVQFTNLSGTDFAGFTNGLRNAEGGVHVTAFYAALKASLDPYAKRGQSFTIHDLREGVIGIINAKLSHPQFDSQTKEKLVDDRASGKVEEFIGKQLKAFFAGNKALAAKICEQADKIRTLKNKFKLSKDAIRSIKKIAKTGFPVNSTVVPDIPSAKRTLFLVEGESAGGCFSGDTEVLLDDGRSASLEQLWKKGETFKGTFLSEGGFKQGVFTAPILTKIAQRLVRVTLDDGTTLVCTPEHPFLTEDGTYVQAQFLSGLLVRRW